MELLLKFNRIQNEVDVMEFYCLFVLIEHISTKITILTVFTIVISSKNWPSKYIQIYNVTGLAAKMRLVAG